MLYVRRCGFGAGLQYPPDGTVLGFLLHLKQWSIRSIQIMSDRVTLYQCSSFTFAKSAELMVEPLDLPLLWVCRRCVEFEA